MQNNNFQVGDAVTYCVGSDRYAYDVVAVSKSGHKLTIRAATSTPAPGFNFYTNQVYTYAPNPAGEVMTAYRTKTGAYRVKRCGILVAGHDEHRDPSF